MGGFSLPLSLAVDFCGAPLASRIARQPASLANHRDGKLSTWL